MSDGFKVERSVLVKESEEKIWDVLTKSEYTKHYMFGCEVISDWTVGSDIKFTGRFMGRKMYTRGTVLEYKPYEYIKYSSFDPRLELEDIPENYIYTSYILTKKDEGIEVKFILEILQDSKEVYDETVKSIDRVMIPGFKKILNIRY
ncbi:MAG: SRPBCC domain-containing protein [Oscillospiraceae bacterium]|nr:SRPBCC domain-containing protein [Oscillospiraceae bacterium]